MAKNDVWVTAVAAEYARIAVVAAFKRSKANAVERHLSRQELATIVNTVVTDAVSRTVDKLAAERDALAAELAALKASLADATITRVSVNTDAYASLAKVQS